MHVEVISEESIKKNILKNSVFAIAKSGTISLEISNVKQCISFFGSTEYFFVLENTTSNVEM